MEPFKFTSILAEVSKEYDRLKSGEVKRKSFGSRQVEAFSKVITDKLNEIISEVNILQNKGE